jgi:hypothetical protein
MKSNTLIAVSVISVAIVGYAAFQLTREAPVSPRTVSSNAPQGTAARAGIERRKGHHLEDEDRDRPAPKRRAKPLPPAEPTPPPPGSDIPLDQARADWVALMDELEKRAQAAEPVTNEDYTNAYMRTQEALQPLMFHLAGDDPELTEAHNTMQKRIQALEPHVPIQHRPSPNSP